MLNHQITSLPPDGTPYIPSAAEAIFYYYGLPSKPRLIARSSSDVWMQPTGAEAYLELKELTPLGVHPLDTVWEDTVGPAIDLYFQEKGVQCTSMNPLRIGIVGQSSPPAIIFIGVNPGSLSHELGIEVAVHCRNILIQNGIDDVHVEIRDSEFTQAAMLYKPAISANPAAMLREPFSTSLGLSICGAKTTNFEGTGGLFFVDSAKPGILYLLTARHVLFPPNKEQNKLYRYCNSTGAPRRNVMLLGEATFNARLEDIKAAIDGKNHVIDTLNMRLKLANEMKSKDDAAAERRSIKLKMDEVNEAIKAFEDLLADVVRDWQEEENRIIGHVVLSPPIRPNYGKDGFTEDWAVVEVHPTKIARLNFIGNAIDLGYVEISELFAWMYPQTANPSSFKYPGDRLLKCFGTVTDQEMFKPDPKNTDHNDPAIMVLKNGNTSKFTVGRLNTIRAFVRVYGNGIANEMSKEVCVLPRNPKSGPFSVCGDSGSVVIDGIGRICGILTGGVQGTTDVSDCTFITSINFLLKRLAAFGIKANIFPLPTDL
ncbi:uncharacterized protein FIBRA_08513 [Fibroporia radiculosa]|uniref:Peptidase S1 domain-containing protein n=1 Tax=Fibroporia radiculosa TaxID=599839 RepID=J4GHL1_9APHY|nr:uncharacterized protein FIBRA_08513 [Fibroporia radiculosa]CCM06263.1 predicted protein [Fibroporia radiculosa]